MLRLIKLGPPAENAAADTLRDLILQSWPDAEASPHCDIRIITGVYLSGQRVEDLDIVLLAAFEQPREIPLVDEGTVVGSYLLGSLCAVIEVKDHRYDAAEVRAGTLWVSYNGDRKNVTKQNRDQMHSLAEFLSTAGAGRPHITRFIWLRNVTASELRQSSTNGNLPHELILKDSTWLHVLTSVWRGWPGRHPKARGFDDNKYFISADINRSTTPISIASASYSRRKRCCCVPSVKTISPSGRRRYRVTISPIGPARSGVHACLSRRLAWARFLQ